MSDTDDDIPDTVEEMYDAMLDLFENKETEDVMSALQSIVSTILCAASLNKESALVNVIMFATGVSISIEKADEEGACAWAERRH